MLCYFMHAALPSVCDTEKVWLLLWSHISAICFPFFPPALALHPTLAARLGGQIHPMVLEQAVGKTELKVSNSILPTTAQGKACAGLF